MQTAQVVTASGSYVETSDITASIAHVEQLGGRVVMPRTVMPGGTLGIFEDPRAA